MIGSRLKFLRTHFGLKQIELAGMLGVRVGTVCDYEKGRANPGYEALMKLRHEIPFLNLDWLLSGEGSMFREETEDDEHLQDPEFQEFMLWYVQLGDEVKEKVRKQIRLTKETLSGTV